LNYIKKIGKISVEKALGVYLNSDLICMGIDVAQHNTGIAIIRITKSHVILDSIYKVTVPKKTEIMNTIDLFIDQVERIKSEISQKYKIDVTMIEDCFFLKNVNTLKCLARFSAIAYDRFRGLSKESHFILPTSARSKVNFKKSSKEIKGDYLKKEIIDYVNKALGIKITDTDEADAIVLALAGLSKNIPFPKKRKKNSKMKNKKGRKLR